MAQKEKEKKLTGEEEMKRDYELLLMLEDVELAMELKIIPMKGKKTAVKEEGKSK